MNQEKSEFLYKTYPEFFANRSLPITQSCMGFGLEIANGWFELLNSMCEEIYTVCEKEQLPKECYPAADQIKEKFAGLRVYFSFKKNTTGKDLNEFYKEIYKIVNKYEIKSESTCEICGDAGKIRGTGWLKTLCQNCNNVLDYSRES